MDRITALEARVAALEQANSKAAAAVAQAYQAMSVADVLMRSAGYPPPDEDAAPSMAVVTPKPNPAPAGATTQEKAMPKLKADAVARQVSESYENEVGVSVRDVAREAARQWGQEHAAKFSSAPKHFGEMVAKVYLAAAADLSEGFASDIEAAGATA